MPTTERLKQRAVRFCLSDLQGTAAAQSYQPRGAGSLDDLNFRFFSLGGLFGFGNITMPPTTTTITGEALSSSAP
jgi:hypothetical protein